MGTPKGQSKHMLGVNPSVHPLTSQWIKANKQYWQRATRDMIEAALRSGELPMILPGRKPRKTRKAVGAASEAGVDGGFPPAQKQQAGEAVELEDPFAGALPVGVDDSGPIPSADGPAGVQPQAVQAGQAPGPVATPPPAGQADPAQSDEDRKRAQAFAESRAKAFEALNQNSF